MASAELPAHFHVCFSMRAVFLTEETGWAPILRALIHTNAEFTNQICVIFRHIIKVVIKIEIKNLKIGRCDDLF